MTRSKGSSHEQYIKDNLGGPSRRDVVVTGSAAFASVLVAGSACASDTLPENMELQPGDHLQLVKGDLRGELLKPDMLVEGDTPIQAFPFDSSGQILRRKNRLNRLLVVRLNAAEMDEPTSVRGIEGVLAYSAICTHRGCTIDSWKAEERVLRCHCHLSEFDALAAGGIVRGPAKRQLAMVPLTLDADGYVVATEGFTARVGGDSK